MEIFEQLGGVDLHIDAAEVAAMSDTEDAYLRVLQALQHHELVFTSSDTDATEESTASSDWGWGALTQGELSVTRVPGSHISMMTRPHVQTLAQRLRELTAGKT